MDDQTSHAASQRIVDALDASVRDIAKGDLHDAQSVLDEARHMLADHHRGRGRVWRMMAKPPSTPI
jgi:hypothetical protein